jgi:hypothetical protein
MLIADWYSFIRDDSHSPWPFLLICFSYLLIESNRPHENRSWLYWISQTSFILIWSAGVARFLLPSSARQEWTVGTWFTIAVLFKVVLLILDRPKLIQLSLR